MPILLIAGVGSACHIFELLFLPDTSFWNSFHLFISIVTQSIQVQGSKHVIKAGDDVQGAAGWMNSCESAFIQYLHTRTCQEESLKSHMQLSSNINPLIDNRLFSRVMVGLEPVPGSTGHTCRPIYLTAFFCTMGRKWSTQSRPA